MSTLYGRMRGVTTVDTGAGVLKVLNISYEVKTRGINIIRVS